MREFTNAEKLGENTDNDGFNTPRISQTLHTPYVPHTSDAPYTSDDEGRGEYNESGLTPIPRIKEIKFFTDPKAVKKKTEGSIIAFQLVFAVLFCVIYKASALVSPELYLNISAYLERLFGW